MKRSFLKFATPAMLAAAFLTTACDSTEEPVNPEDNTPGEVVITASIATFESRVAYESSAEGVKALWEDDDQITIYDESGKIELAKYQVSKLIDGGAKAEFSFYSGEKLEHDESYNAEFVNEAVTTQSGNDNFDHLAQGCTLSSDTFKAGDAVNFAQSSAILSIEIAYESVPKSAELVLGNNTYTLDLANFESADLYTLNFNVAPCAKQTVLKFTINGKASAQSTLEQALDASGSYTLNLTDKLVALGTYTLASVPADAVDIPVDEWIITDSEASTTFGGSNDEDDYSRLKEALTSAYNLGRDITVTFPNMLKVSDYAFHVITYAHKLIFPVATEVGQRAFSECFCIRHIDLPAAKSVGDHAFGYTKTLESINLPVVESLGASVFIDCNALTDLTLSENYSVTDQGMLLNKNKDTLISFIPSLSGGAKDIVLPESVKYMGIYAFENCDFNSVSGAGIVEVPTRACKASTVTSVSFPAATVVGDEAFAYCKFLESVELGEAATVGKGVFDNCIVLKEANLPKAASLGDMAFFNCYELSKVDCSAVESIGDNAFSGCWVLADLSLSKLQTTGANCFEKCKALTSIALPELKTLGAFAFKYCGVLESVSMPKIEVIEANAFATASKITSLEIATESVMTEVAADLGDEWVAFPSENISLTIGAGNGADAASKTWNGYTFKELTIL